MDFTIFNIISSPAGSFTISSSGTVLMPYSWSSSDERIRTNIKTIENALDKFYYYVELSTMIFRYEPDLKHIGLIVQKVELIIPEAVGIIEFDHVRCIKSLTATTVH